MNTVRSRINRRGVRRNVRLEQTAPCSSARGSPLANPPPKQLCARCDRQSHFVNTTTCLTKRFGSSNLSCLFLQWHELHGTWSRNHGCLQNGKAKGERLLGKGQRNIKCYKTRTAEVTICIISERLPDRPRQLPHFSCHVQMKLKRSMAKGKRHCGVS